MKAKELFELLKNVNPDAEIRVNGGFVEYSTKEVEIEVSDAEVYIREK